MKRFVNVYTEASPNPNSLKFVLNFNLLENVSIDFPSVEDTKVSPLAKALFETFPFVQRVFIAANFVTLTKTDDVDWFEINPKILQFIKSYFEEEKTVFTEEIKKEVVQQDLKQHVSGSVIEERIISVLNDYVRPAVEQDGGAIQFHSFNEGVVKVLLQGSCSGCPSSTITLKSGIETLLKKMIPEVTEVVAEGV